MSVSQLNETQTGKSGPHRRTFAGRDCATGCEKTDKRPRRSRLSATTRDRPPSPSTASDVESPLPAYYLADCVVVLDLKRIWILVQMALKFLDPHVLLPLKLGLHVV